MTVRFAKRAALAAALTVGTALGAAAQTPPAEFPAAALGAAQAKLGHALLEKMAADPAHGRLVVSPAGVAAVLADLDLGADEAMHAAIVRTLGFDGAKGDAAMASLRRTAQSLAAAAAKDGPLTFADAIFVDAAVSLEDAARRDLAAAGIETQTQPLATMPGVAAVNDWVDKHTKGAIKSILDNPIPGAAFVAVNALHFKDDWRFAFPAAQTKPHAFATADGKALEVPMMALPASPLAFRQDDRFIAVSLPYKTAGLSLLVVTTKDRPASFADFAPAASWLDGSGFAEARGTVALPRFGVESSAHLLGHLDALGLREARTPTAFGKFTKSPALLTDVVQKTMIKVDETGTEAAAATAAITTRALRPTDTVEMVVDKPFLFALRDERNGLTLMTGYVDDPTGK
ncbi:MAG: serpin family protein [Bauldia sp.]